jgi:hypothetical protein
VGIILLAEVQRAYHVRKNGQRRVELRQYLLDRVDPSAFIYQLVSRCLYARSLIDNLGLCDSWINAATEAERASLFSEIASTFLKA